MSHCVLCLCPQQRSLAALTGCWLHQQRVGWCHRWRLLLGLSSSTSDDGRPASNRDVALAFTIWRLTFCSRWERVSQISRAPHCLPSQTQHMSTPRPREEFRRKPANGWAFGRQNPMLCRLIYLSSESAPAAIKPCLMVDLSIMASFYKAESVSFYKAKPLTRQVRACTRHGGHRDCSQVGVDNSYNLCMHSAAVLPALAARTLTPQFVPLLFPLPSVEHKQIHIRQPPVCLPLPMSIVLRQLGHSISQEARSICACHIGVLRTGTWDPGPVPAVTENESVFPLTARKAVGRCGEKVDTLGFSREVHHPLPPTSFRWCMEAIACSEWSRLTTRWIRGALECVALPAHPPTSSKFLSFVGANRITCDGGRAHSAPFRGQMYIFSRRKSSGFGPPPFHSNPASRGHTEALCMDPPPPPPPTPNPQPPASPPPLLNCSQAQRPAPSPGPGLRQ